MPVTIALAILTGGLAAAIMDGGAAVGWAALVALALIADTEIYRRLDAAEVVIAGRTLGALAGWGFVSSCFFAVLPAALWMEGAPAGAAAAIVLWVAGVMRVFGPGCSGAMSIALASAAPNALGLMTAPLAMAALSPQADWDLAVIATLGGGALMAYAVQSRLRAHAAETETRAHARHADKRAVLGELVIEQGRFVALLVDGEGRVVALSRRACNDLGVSVGEAVENALAPALQPWRDAFARACAGVHARFDASIAGHAVVWTLRPWRDHHGDIVGVFAQATDVAAPITVVEFADQHDFNEAIAKRA